MEKLLSKSYNLLRLIERSQPRDAVYDWVGRHPMAKAMVRDIEALLPCVISVHTPPDAPTPSKGPVRAVCWNIDRGKKNEEIISLLKTHPKLANADLIFVTEADWGMARSGNCNVTADIAAALNMYAYFAPTYVNLTHGHGAERGLGGENTFGLHGNSILSKYPLKNLRVAKLKNATDKFRNKEARLGQQTALMGEFQLGGQWITAVCVHLDAFSSHKQRAAQMQSALSTLPSDHPVILGGDWNTSTYDSRNTLMAGLGLLYKTLFFGPRKIMRDHYLHPDKRFDRRIFHVLKQAGFDYKQCNELGVGTFDLVLGDIVVEQMASDKFPKPIRKFVEWMVKINGGGCSLKVDWFALRKLVSTNARVVRLSEAKPGAVKPSDHHPIMVEF